jgi:hypothetical protein
MGFSLIRGARQKIANVSDQTPRRREKPPNFTPNILGPKSYEQKIPIAASV